MRSFSFESFEVVFSVSGFLLYLFVHLLELVDGVDGIGGHLGGGVHVEGSGVGFAAGKESAEVKVLTDFGDDLKERQNQNCNDYDKKE